MNNKYWDIAIKEDNSNIADLYLYNIIDDYAYEGYADSAESILKDLNDLGNLSTLNVYINSPGGSVFEGIAIKNMLDRLKTRKCAINVSIDGVAASIASIIAMVGDKITMPENALMMIHRASCGCYGNASDMKKQIEVLNKIDQVLTNTYVNRSNGILTAEKIQEMFDSGDTWLTAQEAMSYGLCDEIVEGLAVAACAKSTKFENKLEDKWVAKVEEWASDIQGDKEPEGEIINMADKENINVTVKLDLGDIKNMIKDAVSECYAEHLTKFEVEAKTAEPVKIVAEPEAKVDPGIEPEATEPIVEPEAKVEPIVEPEAKVEEPVAEPENINPFAFMEYLNGLK